MVILLYCHQKKTRTTTLSKFWLEEVVNLLFIVWNRIKHNYTEVRATGFYWWRNWSRNKELTENLYAKTEKDKVLKWLDLNKQNIHFLPALQGNFLLNYHLLCIPKDYFLKLVICTRKSVIVCFKRPAKNKQLLILFFLIL